MALGDPFFDDRVASREAAVARRGEASWGELIAVAVAALVLALGAGGRAVHGDEPTWLALGEALREGGLGGFGRAAVAAAQERGEVALGGPLLPALFALAPSVGLEATGLADLVFAVLLAGIGASAVSLAARVGAAPLAVGLSAALGPLGLVLVGVRTPAFLSAGLVACSLALAVRGVMRDASAALVGAGLLGALAAVAHAHGLVALVLLAATPLLWRGGRAGFVPAGVALGVVVLCSTFERIETGRVGAFAAFGALGERDHGAALAAALGGLGGAALGWVVAAALAPRRLAAAVLGDAQKVVLALVGALIGVALVMDATLVRDFDPDGVNLALTWLVLLGGAIVLLAALGPWMDVAALRRGGVREWRERRGPDAWIALWLASSFGCAWLAVPEGAARHALVALVPMLLLAGAFAARHLPGRVVAAAALASALVGTTSAIADARAAQVGPRIAAEVAAELGEHGLWTFGRTRAWGDGAVRWHLERAGVRRAELPVRPGDRILRNASMRAHAPRESESLLVFRVEKSWSDPWPVRLQAPAAGAGFWSCDAGFLPFAITDEVVETLRVFDVREP